jgi:Shikimate kinase
MGVGKSTVAKCLAYILGCEKLDLDRVIENAEGRSISEIIKTEGEAHFRRIETENLRKIITETNVRIIALGGGTWTVEENRALIKKHNCTSVWLESTFEHCWRNITASKQERPLAKNRELAERLFYERQMLYCLADWHFVMEPRYTSFETAKRIAEEIF